MTDTERSEQQGLAAPLAGFGGRPPGQHRGVLRIYLGAAAGVGKTFAMLGEAHRRKSRGADVVVAFVETHGRRRTAEQVSGLEVLPRARIAYRGTSFEEMDVDAVLARHPQVCLVDGLAYDNPPGSRHPKRYQDVEDLLEAGISVLTSINLEYIAEQQEFVRHVLGKAKADTVPQEFIDRADEVVVVDAPTEGFTGIEEQQLAQLR